MITEMSPKSQANFNPIFQQEYKQTWSVSKCKYSHGLYSAVAYFQYLLYRNISTDEEKNALNVTV